ncbi:single-stranded DNA-binding protein [Sulfobacillus thermosulfidooxidans]|uniref:single-stranded DNA-binding protein n=1 Tax=Sulfobacillus thermosulfidooxidans TaxID=28034 RepID=UPI0002DE0B40|nr:single-stranded DNA-binding protein [Sulfobacillus thermosulfidooxidans]
MMNRIILIGRLTRDPELRYTPQGVAVTGFTLAVDRPFTNAQGEREADFIDCVAWRKLAETVGNHLHKGRLVAVEGRLQIRSYEASDGSKRRAAEVIAESVRFLDAPKEKAGAPLVPPSLDVEEMEGLPDDLPF